MGVVYRAEHRGTGQQVALKMVSIAEHERLAGIRAEIQTLAKLDHPGIVRLLDQGLEGGLPWYAMELLEGQTLSRVLDDVWGPRTGVERTASAVTAPAPAPGGEQGWSEPQAVAPRQGLGPVAGGRVAEMIRMFRQICLTLSFLHGRGIVHRDLKPSNFFVRRDGTVVLMDFGLTSRARGSVGREALELAGRLVGTPMYTAPEQLSRQATDARADLYALGCMLYEALTGQVPFRSQRQDLLVQQQLHEPPLPPSVLVADLDPRLEALTLRLLSKKARDRIGHADDVARMLAEIGGITEPTPAVPRSYAYLYRPEPHGRDAVIADLERQVDQLERAQGSFVCLAGESGIGKTFVAAEISKRARQRQLRVIGGECTPPTPVTGASGLETGGLPLHPWWPLLEAIGDRCRELGREACEQRFGSRLRLLAPYAPALAQLGERDAAPEPADLPAEETQRRLIETLRDLLAAFVRHDGPLLLVLDDLQWADELSLRVLASLTPEWLAERGLMVLATYRSDEVGPGLREVIGGPGVRSINLARLDGATVGEIASDMLATGPLPPTLLGFLADHSEGVPFFVAEYLRAAVGEGLLYRQDAHWTVDGNRLSEAALRALPLPHSIQEIMLHRLAGLGPELGAVVDVAAVIGRQFALDLVAGVLGIAPELARERAVELVHRQVFDLAPDDEVDQYRFVHDKLRETAYAALSGPRREQLHREVALRLEAGLREDGGPSPYGELANHFLQGHLWDRAVTYLEKAGTEAAARFANREAIQFFGTAVATVEQVALPIAPRRLARWHRHLVDSHLGLGEMPEAHRQAGLALRHCGFRLPSPRTWGMALLGQAALRLVQRTLPVAFRVRSEERRAATDEAAYVLNRLCEPFFLSKRPLQGFYCGLRDLNLADRVPASEALARGYGVMAMVVGVGAMGKLGRSWSDRAVSISRQLGAENALAYCLSRASVVHMTQADWDAGLRSLAEATAMTRQRQDLRQLGEALTTSALLCGYRGDFRRALVEAEQVAAVGVARGDEQLRHWGRNLTVHALARLGRSRESLPIVRAMEQYQRSHQLGEAERIFDFGGFALVHRELGDPTEALRFAGLVLSGIRREPFLPYFLKTALDASAEVHLAVLEQTAPDHPDRKRLLASAAEAVARLRRFAGLYASARPRALLLHGQVLWQRGRTRQALATWGKALNQAEARAMAYDAARARLELGRHLPPGRQESGSDRAGHLRLAARVFEDGGNLDDLGRAEAALAGGPRE
jgi:serine/threonine protein kinase